MADGRMTAAAFLVAELRRARTRRGLSQDELAKAVNYSASMVSAVELGQQQPTAKYLELVDRALDTGGIFGRMLTELVALDKAQVWLRGWRGILAEAWALRWFDPLHVPGLLQTEAYARAVFESDPLLEPDEVERRLADRMDSQGVLYAERPPRLVAVLDEAVLRRRVGGRKVMCDQALHLARIGTEHPQVRLHVVPSSADEYPGLNGPFILASLAGGVELAFLGGQIGGQELDHPTDLVRLQRTWEATLGMALPPQESVERLREIAESWN
ncbi:helix-turn-helix domain-containing protein [Micromonospora halophytica]|uniref:Helix-turn-helix domain-containing protein n=1 Tax=Micromonospora halophytica TaxID=47864 RepID=A0A1C5IEQ7_9ACTN|nr:helix-turn-helix transcriptional regulator [Micromonospora halophytica]SCG56857.1 Helix-turn-helix domain-containing protein [Micromonospora halophytica]